MSQEHDIAAIAAGLTKAQREALGYCREKAGIFNTCYMHDGTRKALWKKGLTRGGNILTPLGSAVKAHLEGKEP